MMFKNVNTNGLKSFAKTAVGKSVSFTRDSLEFAFPGMLIGAGVIVANSPTFAGIALINVTTLFWFAVFMLCVGVSAAIIHRMLKPALKTETAYVDVAQPA